MWTGKLGKARIRAFKFGVGEEGKGGWIEVLNGVSLSVTQFLRPPTQRESESLKRLGAICRQVGKSDVYCLGSKIFIGLREYKWKFWKWAKWPFMEGVKECSVSRKALTWVWYCTKLLNFELCKKLKTIQRTALYINSVEVIQTLCVQNYPKVVLVW